MRKNRVRLTESQLHRVIKESVRRVLREKKIIKEYIDAIDDDEVEEEVVKQGNNYILTKGWYLEDSLTDYKCIIYLTTQQINAFNNWVDKLQQRYIDSDGEGETPPTCIKGSGRPYDNERGLIAILENFTDLDYFDMPDRHNVRYIIETR